MVRRWIAALLVTVLLVVPGAGLAHHGYCFYDPSDMRTYGCTDDQAHVLNQLVQMAAAGERGDWSAYWTARDNALEMIREARLGWSIATDLSHYQVLDSKMVGKNVKFTTLPNGKFLMEDRFGRSIKIAGKSHTGQTKAAANWWLALLGGMAFGAVGEVVLWGSATKWLILSEGVASAWWTYAVDSLPEAGETEYLLHLLHPVGEAGEQVYRANIRVKADGSITVKAAWEFLGWRTPGGEW